MSGKILIFCIGLIFAIELNAQSSASGNVHIPDDSIFIGSLQRNRLIRIYLPPDYHSSNRRYPVLYMHDGQNLFDSLTAYAGEWRVDESLDSIFIRKNLGLIIVGIDNGGVRRMHEYAPWVNETYHDPQEAEGKEYVQFIVEQLKPYVDKTYRTLSESRHTGIMGSSMGGLIAHYAIITYPETFGKAGIFSPSYWFNPEIYNATSQLKKLPVRKIYILQGGNEFEGMPELTQKMVNTLKSVGLSGSKLRYEMDEAGTHSESFWATYFPEAVRFLFKERLYRK
jgi:alpha-glucosidase